MYLEESAAWTGVVYTAYTSIIDISLVLWKMHEVQD